MTDHLERPKEDIKKDAFQKERQRFWQKETFFYHLVFHGIVSSILIMVATASLFFSLPVWENLLFPGLQKIDPLQRDLTILQAKVEQLTQGIQNIPDKNAEIEALKGQFSALQQAVTALDQASPKIPSSVIQPAPEAHSLQISIDFKSLWEKLQKQLQMGEGCREEFNQLQLKIPSSLESSLQSLAVFAVTPAKSLSSLQTELEKIYHQVKSSAHAQDIVTISQSDSWGQKVWDYLSKWIHVRALDKKTAQVSLLTAIEKGLECLRKNQLATAMEYLKSITSIEEIQTWLTEAERRQQCDHVIAKFDKDLKGAKQGGNEQ